MPASRIRALRKVKTTDLTLRALLTEKEREFNDALDGLIGCCMAALKGNNLYSLQGDGLFSQRTSERRRESAHAVRLFVLERLEELVFKPYSGKSRRKILLAALDDRFSFLPRLCILRFIDKLRKESRREKAYFVALGKLEKSLRHAAKMQP